MPPGAPHLLLYILSLVQVSGVPELGETKSEYMKDHGQEGFENSTLLDPNINCQELHWLMEKAMALHSSTVAQKMPWMEEPGGLQSMGSLRVGHD